MKILILTNLFPPHHASTFQFECESMVNALRDRGHEVRVLTSNHGMRTEQRDTEIERRLLLNDVYGHERISNYFPLRTLETRNHAMLQETLTDFCPDLVHVWSLHGLSKLLIFGLKRSRVPTVYAVLDHWLSKDVRNDAWLSWWNHVSPAFPHKLGRMALEILGVRNRYDAKAPTRIVKGVDRIPNVYAPEEKLEGVQPNSVSEFTFERIYFSSQFLKECVLAKGFKVDHGSVLHSGLQSSKFYGEVKPANAPVKRYLLASRLADGSGAFTAAEALKLARGSGADATLSLYGKGDSDYIAKLKSFCVTNELPVDFPVVAHQQKDLPALYRQYDALLHTAEGDDPFPLNCVEAMACGLPVIGTRAGGAAELLRHGENALTFEAGNAEELASRIHELQVQPHLRVQLAETAQQEAHERFNDAYSVDQVEGFLNETLEVWQGV